MNGKWKCWNRRILAFALIVAVVLPSLATVHFASRADDTGSSNVKLSDFKAYIGDDENNAINEDTLLRDGDQLNIMFNWALENNAEQNQFEAVIDPIAGIKIEEFSSDTLMALVEHGDGTSSWENVGKFKIVTQDGKTKMIFNLNNDEYIKAKGERKGWAKVTGTIALNENSSMAASTQEIQVGDYKQSFTYIPEDAGKVTVSKYASGEIYSAADNSARQNFSVLIYTQYGDVKDVSLKDVAGTGLTDAADFKIDWSNGITGLTSEAYASMDELNDALKKVTMPAGSSVSISYSMKVDQDLVAESPQETYTNQAECSYEDKYGNTYVTKSNEVTITAPTPEIRKNGVVNNNDGTVTWTISVDLKGGAALGLHENAITRLVDTPGEGFKEKEIDLLNTAMEQSGSKYIWKYTTTMTDDMKNTVTQVPLKNSVTATINGKDYNAEGTVYTQGMGVSVFKSAVGCTDGIIEWKVSLTLPNGITEAYISDNPVTEYGTNKGNHEWLPTIKFGDKTVVENGAIVSGNGVFDQNTGWKDGHPNTYRLDNTFLNANLGKTITFTYYTKVNDDSMAGKQYKNQATVMFYDGKGTSSRTVEAVYVDKNAKAPVLYKEGQQAYPLPYDINYTLRINLAAIENLQEGKDIVITDRLPDNMQFVQDSQYVQEQQQEDWGFSGLSWELLSKYGYVENQTKVSYQPEQGTVTFTIHVDSNLIEKVEAVKNNKKDPYIMITYRTEVKDKVAFEKEGDEEADAVTFTNQAELQYDGASLDQVSVDVNLPKQKLIEKKAGGYNSDGVWMDGEAYYEANAPYIKYTIVINPDGLDLSTGDSYIAKDTLGPDSAMTYDLTDSEIKVEQQINGTWQVMDRTNYSYHYNMSENALLFTLPDKVPIRISYRTIVGLDRAEGTKLTKENSTNTVELEGYSNAVGASSTYFSSRAVVGARAAGEGTSPSISLKKYTTGADGNMVYLNGAEFRLVKVNIDEAGNLVDGEVVFPDIVVNSADSTNDGLVTISPLNIDQIYALYEIAAPTGYAQNTNKYYFLISGSEKKVQIPENLGIRRYTDMVTPVIMYENEPITQSAEPAADESLQTEASSESESSAEESTETSQKPTPAADESTTKAQGSEEESTAAAQQKEDASEAPTAAAQEEDDADQPTAAAQEEDDDADEPTAAAQEVSQTPDQSTAAAQEVSQTSEQLTTAMQQETVQGSKVSTDTLISSANGGNIHQTETVEIDETTGVITSSSAVQTDDSANMWRYIILSILSMGMLIVTGVMYGKKRLQ